MYTTDITGTAGYGSGNYVPNFNGTSSATPHAAGVAALVISVDPELRSWEVEEIIKLSAKELGVAGRDEEYGHGRVDARAALEAASKIWYAIHVEPVFLGSGRECYMRATIRMYNPGINRVRLDSLTLSSRTRDWTHEIDRFEYRPNPGNLLEPRSNHDIRLNSILLPAIGTSSSWSYRWHLGWSYTFWRPAGPGLPLEGNDPGEGRSTTSWGVRGESNSAVAELECASGETSAAHDLTDGAIPGERFDQDGDVVAVDRRSRAITIVVR